jgi:hypothetical protein
MNKIRLLIVSSVALAAALLFAPQIAHAASDPSYQLTALSSQLPIPFLAQVIPSESSQLSAPGSQLPAATPWYLSTEFFAAIFSTVAGIVAILQNKAKTTAEKVSASLVVAIEAASKIPQVAEHEKAIKAKLQEKLTKSGAQPVVAALLEHLT